MLDVKLTGQWAEMNRIGRTMVNKFKKVVEEAVFQEADYIREKMVAGIESQAPGGRPFTPISPVTRALRKLMGGSGGRALISTETLLRSIGVKKFGPLHYKVGPQAGKQAKGRISLAKLVKIQEGGATIRRTQRMNRFLHAMMRRAGIAPDPTAGGGSTIRIPARPFQAPTMKKHARPADVEKRLKKRIAAGMGGDFGTG